MPEPSVVFYLALFTFGAALIYGVWQFRRAKQAKAQNKHPALAVNLEKPAQDKNQ
jgi:hypothetical protein